MKPLEYHMSAADLRTFDRWHARGALILLVALAVLPWIVGSGPNTWRESAAMRPAPSEAAPQADRAGGG